MLIFPPNAKSIAALAAKSLLPTIFVRREYAEAGSLMLYGPNNIHQFRHAATYVDKILMGAKPGDLPVMERSVSSFGREPLRAVARSPSGSCA